MTDRTSLAAAKFAFIEAIACDPSVSALDLRVNTLLISRYLNSERGDAWPSPARLAEELGASESGVKKSFARLSDRWWKQTIKGGGKGHTSHYQPRWETVPATVRKEDQTVPAPTPFEGETVPARDSNRTEPGLQTVPAPVLEPLEEPLEEPTETNIPRSRARFYQRDGSRRDRAFVHDQ